MKEVFEEVSHYFFLLSEPTRLKILYALCDGEQPVGTIVKQIEANQANVSRQLNMLYQAKILQRRKNGAQVYYRIEDENAIQLCRVVCAQMVEKVIQQTSRLTQAPVDSFVVKQG
ncbi:transcriptional regulator [Massilia eurypsychrophila]|uniref:Transcriptional regulator n=2 Tax=Massilia eurypsychrophila TaxID=1485217 RepID=A0A2G8TF55_9BURK|nr:transcriptional regulator [Massilia eurypsychrophila]